MNGPVASSVEVSARMRNQRSYDTGIEVALRRILYRAGLRYRVHSQVIPGTRRSVDLAFIGACVAVFVDGCFWHSCPEHGTSPKANHDWWQAKLEANRFRDQDTDGRLTDAGWRVMRVWEHEDLAGAAIRIEKAVRERSKLRRPGQEGKTSNGQHGTVSMYGNWGCRCVACRAANTQYQKGLVERYRALGGRGQHETEYRYKTGCRCELCRRAHAEADRDYRKTRASARAQL